MVAGWQSCHSGRWQLPCAPPRLAGMWVPLCRRPCSGSLMLPRGVRPVALQASDVVRKRQRCHCGGCFCAAFRYSARPVRWRAPAGILLLHLSCMLVARGVWPCRRGRLALQYGPFGPVIRAVSHGHTSRVTMPKFTSHFSYSFTAIVYILEHPLLNDFTALEKCP